MIREHQYRSDVYGGTCSYQYYRTPCGRPREDHEEVDYETKARDRMHDTEGTELQPGDIIEWLRDPGQLLMVTEKQDGGDGLVRVKCLCEGCKSDGLDIYHFRYHTIRLVERPPTPEYYKHTRGG